MQTSPRGRNSFPSREEARKSTPLQSVCRQWLIVVATWLCATVSVESVKAATTPTLERAKPTTAPRVWDFFAHWRARRAKIAEECGSLDAATTGTVVLLGDSITEGHPAKRIAGRRVINMGIGGDQIAMDGAEGGVRNRLEFLSQARPAHVFLLIGINDLGASKPLTIAKRQYEDLVAAIRATVPSAQLHLQSILPTRGRFAHLNSRVEELNIFICQVAAREKCDFVDLWSVMADENGELRAEYTRDGLHLVAPAYEKWIAVLEERVGASRWWRYVPSGTPIAGAASVSAVATPTAVTLVPPRRTPARRGSGVLQSEVRTPKARLNQSSGESVRYTQRKASDRSARAQRGRSHTR